MCSVVGQLKLFFMPKVAHQLVRSGTMAPCRTSNFRGCRILAVTVLLACVGLLLLRSVADLSVFRIVFFIPGSAQRSSVESKAYGIMFDAGSTGTRIHVFTMDKLPG